MCKDNAVVFVPLEVDGVPAEYMVNPTSTGVSEINGTVPITAENQSPSPAQCGTEGVQHGGTLRIFLLTLHQFYLYFPAYCYPFPFFQRYALLLEMVPQQTQRRVL